MSESVEKAISSALESFVTNHLAPLQQELRKGLAQALAGSAPAAAGSSSAALNSAYYRIAGARSQTEALQGLLDATGDFARRSAVLVVKGDRLTGWRARGFDGGAADKVRELNLPADGDGGWRRALSEQAATTGVVEAAPEPVRQALFATVGAPADNRCYLLPLIVRERPVAALYADGGATSVMPDLAALDLLTRLAGLCLELSAVRQRTASAPASAAQAAAPAPAEVIEMSEAAPPVEPPPAAPPPTSAAPAVAAAARAPGPDFDNIPAEDHDVHKKAFRSAKLLVDDLILYNKDKIEQGRAQGNIYSAIHEDVDKSRAHYGKKWSGTAAGKVDYFHQELMRRVANNDPAVLGGEYPGPLV